MQLAQVRNAIDVMRIDVTRELRERTAEVPDLNTEYLIAQEHAKKYVDFFLPIATEREAIGLFHVVAAKDLKTQELEAAVITACINRFNLIDTALRSEDPHATERELWRIVMERIVGGHGLVAAYSKRYHELNDDMMHHTSVYIGEVNTNPHKDRGFVFVDGIRSPADLQASESLINHNLFNTYNHMLMKDDRRGGFPFKLRIDQMPLWCPWTALSVEHMRSLYDKDLIPAQVYQQHRLENVRSNQLSNHPAFELSPPSKPVRPVARPADAPKPASRRSLGDRLEYHGIAVSEDSHGRLLLCAEGDTDLPLCPNQDKPATTFNISSFLVAPKMPVLQSTKFVIFLQRKLANELALNRLETSTQRVYIGRHTMPLLLQFGAPVQGIPANNVAIDNSDFISVHSPPNIKLSAILHTILQQYSAVIKNGLTIFEWFVCHRIERDGSTQILDMDRTVGTVLHKLSRTPPLVEVSMAPVTGLGGAGCEAPDFADDDDRYDFNFLSSRHPAARTNRESHWYVH